MNQRNGTDVDAANAMKTFGKLGYKVKVFNDQTVDQIKKLLAGGKTDGVEVFFFNICKLYSRVVWLCPVFEFSSVTWHYVQSKRSKTIAFVRSLYGRRNRKTPPSLIGERRHSHCKKTLTLGFHGIVLHC